MSGDKRTQTTNTTTSRSPTGPAAGLAQSTAGMTQSWLDNPASQAVYSGDRVAGLSDMTMSGVNALPNSGQQSRGYFDSVLAGDYLGKENPFTDQMYDSIKSRIMPTVNNQFSAAGMVGSSMHGDQMTRALSDSLAPIMYQNYQNERGYQNAAAGDLVNLDQLQADNTLRAGSILDTQQQRELDAQRQMFEEQRTAPLRTANEALGVTNALGNMYNTQTTNGTTTQSNQPGLASMIGGTAMTAAGIASTPGLFGSGYRQFQQQPVYHQPSFWGQNQTVRAY